MTTHTCTKCDECKRRENRIYELQCEINQLQNLVDECERIQEEMK